MHHGRLSLAVLCTKDYPCEILITANRDVIQLSRRDCVHAAGTEGYSDRMVGHSYTSRVQPINLPVYDDFGAACFSLMVSVIVTQSDAFRAEILTSRSYRSLRRSAASTLR